MGIPVRLHWTFLLVILYVAWAFASFSQQVLGRTYGLGSIEPASFRWIYSLVFAVVLFACVALHELGHSYIAHKNGIEHKEHNALLLRRGLRFGGDPPQSPPGATDGLCRAGSQRRHRIGLCSIGLPVRRRQCCGHHALDSGHHEPHPHGLQSHPCLSHGRRPPLAGLVCHPHAVRKSYQECGGYRKDVRDTDVSCSACSPSTSCFSLWRSSFMWEHRKRRRRRRSASAWRE